MRIEEPSKDAAIPQFIAIEAGGTPHIDCRARLALFVYPVKDRAEVPEEACQSFGIDAWFFGEAYLGLLRPEIEEIPQSDRQRRFIRAGLRGRGYDCPIIEETP